MKSLNLSILAVGGALVLSSCATYGPSGIIYSGGTTGVTANNDVSSAKTGKACVTSILSLVSSGDGSIKAAKDNGGITKVATVDYDAFNVLGVYGNYCTIVTGE